MIRTSPRFTAVGSDSGGEKSPDVQKLKNLAFEGTTNTWCFSGEKDQVLTSNWWSNTESRENVEEALETSWHTEVRPAWNLMPLVGHQSQVLNADYLTS